MRQQGKDAPQHCLDNIMLIDIGLQETDITEMTISRQGRAFS